ncbi:uncharacterized protein KIAA1522 homolog isoform X2 [Brienomyrus brachyistius]|uniref:uncharacterized protein KIAA1522 homolog isoform X2 n=1 Tax=Brienomyrus brachyistius TaxID=42636 RepID=UPI0020B242AB|nr:uncharacterized protein KIAA1522 homolog isoform X2 [Brienomyrus brachyistius]
MSRRNSVGDLVPRDITEVLARDAKTNKAKRKNGGSLSRALGWFRGDRKKKSDGGGRPEPRSRLADSQMAKHSHTEPDCTKAASKPEDDRRLTVHYQASPHYQENVFIEGSRPHYLQDLHIEAQEGLKKLQQDEKRSDLDFQDGQSVSSSAVLPAGGDSEPQNRTGSLESGSTAGDSVLMSPRRSSLSRQGSTFKPLNPTKKVERSKKRGRRTTIMGIPQHVQKELGLEKSTLFRQNMDRQLTNGREAPPDVVVIPTVDGDVPAVNHEGARVHLLDLEVLHSSKEERLLKQHIQEVYRDDLALGRQFGHRLSPSLRPKSLAVPGLTTTGFLQEPQGPVMSISPQATYLSKIIPNAILPVAVDVIEISRCRSRSSVRTVSKSSVASGSPASSRSQVRHGPSSADSNWSHSQSSETIVSNSSTISSKGSASHTLVPNGTMKENEQSRQLAPDQLSLGSATSWVSSASAGTKPQVELNSHAMQERDEGESQRSDHSCVRSMSVMKTRMPPAPPTRTYSLHSKNIKPCLPEVTYSEVSVGKISRVNGVKHNNILEEALSLNLTDSAESPTNSADSSLDDSRSSVSSSIITPDQTVTLDSVLSSGESSPQKPFQDNKFDRTLSPSSGYSSQSGTPTLSAKEICPPSPGKMKAKPAKPERIGSRASPIASISSSLTSLSSAISEPVHQEARTNGLPPQIPKASYPVSVDSAKVSPTLGTRSLKEVFDIPPPPKVKAPCPPPPETWMHNRRTFDLLCSSRGVANRFPILQKQQATVLLHDQSQGTAEGQQQDEDLISKKKEVVMESQREQASVQNSEFSAKCFGDSPAVKIDEGPVMQTAEHAQKQELTEPAKDQSLDGEDLQLHQINQKKEQEDMVKKMPPPVMKRSSLIAYKKENLKAEENLLAQMKTVLPEVKILSSPEEIFATQKEGSKVKDPVVGLKSTMQTLLVEGPKKVGISPPPSPPPSHQPPPPPSKKIPPIAVTSVFQDDLQETPTIESSWPPPPPPPMEENSTPIFEGQDELDFPPPPPPVFQETLLDGVVNFPVAKIQTMPGATEERAVEEEPPEEFAPATHMGTANEECRTQVVTHTGGDVTQESTGSSATFVNPITTEIHIHCSTTPLEIRPTSTVSQYSESQVPQLPPSLPEGIPPPPQEAPPLPPATVIQTDPPTFSHVPHGSILLGEKQATLSFKRTSITHRDGKGKDQLSRSKSTPVPKEDANIPLVTPSLLQMVRLRSVNVSDDQTTTPAESIKPTESNSSNQDQSQTQTCSHSVPQKPIRKSLSMKSPPPVGTSSSMRLQEAIRMKTAAMRPKEGLPARPSLQSSGGMESGALSPRSPEGGDIHKSPASTASFIFSRSTKKVIIETPTSPELQSSLKQSLAAELMQITDSSSSSVASNPCAQTQTKKPSKVPPPVARKPEYVPNQREKSTSQSANVENANGHTGGVQPAGQQAQQTNGN